MGQTVVSPIKTLRIRFIVRTSFNSVHFFTSLEQQNAFMVWRTTRASMCARPTQFQEIGQRYPAFIANLMGVGSYIMLALFR